MAIEALEQANARQVAYSSSHPKDFQAYIIGFNVMAELAPAYLRVGNPGKAAELVENLIHSHAARVAACGSQTDSLTTSELSGLILSLTCVSRLLDYCEQAALEDKSMLEDRRTEIVETHRRNRQLVLADLSTNVEMWSKSVMKSESPLDEIESLLGSNDAYLFKSLVNSKTVFAIL